MDLKNTCKIIKDKADFYLKFLFEPNRTKNKEMKQKKSKTVSSISSNPR
jgi:hypothetical protein